MTELGQHLKKVRTEKNISYEELQEMTKIQKRYLQSIEEGNYAVLPGAFYARAFIKNYAEAVGLDSDQLFHDYPSDLPADEERKVYTPRATKKKAEENKFTRVLPMTLTLLLLTSLLVGLYWFITTNTNNMGSEPNQDNVDDYQSTTGKAPRDSDAKQTPSSSETADEEISELEFDEKPASKQKLIKLSTQGITSTYKLVGTNEFKVELKTLGKVYVDIKNESNKFLQPSKTFAQGEILTYSLGEQKTVTFNIGATQNVAMNINDQLFTFPIEPSKKRHQRIIIQFKKGSNFSTE